MDLFEYQARDMFEKHGVPVLAGAIATTPEQARAAAEQIGPKSGGVTVVKAQVKTGGRGKAGGVKVTKSPEEAQAAAEAILGMDIKGHTVGTVMIAQGARIAEEYYFSVLLDRANRTYLAMCSKEGGMEIEQARRRAPGGPGPHRRRPQHGHRRRQGAGDRRRRRLRRRRQGRDRRRHPEGVDRLPRGGRDARRGQPARQDRGRPDRRPRRQGDPRRERRLPPPGPRGARGHGPRGPARGSGQGEGPQLRQGSTAPSASSATARVSS